MTRWQANWKQAPWLLLAAVLALPLTGHAEIYKCRLPGGQTEISNTPCGTAAATLGVRPDETISAPRREQAERDVERMRNFVEKREAAQRADDQAESRRQAEVLEAHARQRVYQANNMDDCLAELDQQAVDSRRRAELEAICRAKPRPAPAPTVIQMPVAVPAFGHAVSGSGLSVCIQNVMRLRLAPAEQSRRVDLCQAQYPSPPVTPIAPPPGALHPSTPSTGQPAYKPPCPRGDKFCALTRQTSRKNGEAPVTPAKAGVQPFRVY